MDWSNSRAVVAAAARVGFTATLTYPGNPREGHHVNFRREPKIAPPFPVLRRGHVGLGVATLTRRLAYIRDPHGTPYLAHAQRTFDRRVELVLAAFQRDHGQRADGVYGRQTSRQLAASVRWEKRRRRQVRAARKGKR